MDINDNQRKPSLTTFNFELPEDNTNEEGVLAKIFDKVISAVSGQPHIQDNISVRNYASPINATNDKQHSVISSNDNIHNRQDSVDEITATLSPSFIPQQRQLQLPTSHSATSSLSRHLTTASSSTTSVAASSKDSVTPNFPVSMQHLDSVPRSSTSTTATTTTTVTVQKSIEQQETESKDDDSDNMELTNSTVQFVMPTTGRRSLEDSRASLDYLMNSPLAKRRSIDSDTQSIATNFSISNSNSLSRMLARLRGHKGDKEFWMPDEQCKECYKCRKQFTLLRRKHHCRICGQIFCARCASHVISGKSYKQKGQVRVCNFCYAEQLQQIKENLSKPNLDVHEYQQSRSKERTARSRSIENMKNKDNQPSKQHQQDQQHEGEERRPRNAYESPIIPYQKPPLAVPQMQIPTTALRQTRSTYGNEDTTMFALEIPTHGAGSPIMSSMIERPRSPNVNNPLDSPTLSNSNLMSSANMIPSITTTNASNMDLTAGGGLKRLLDAGTSLLKSTSRPRSNTSSSAPVEDTRYPNMIQYVSPGGPFRSNSNYPFAPYLLDRGGGTVLAESELSPFPGHSSHAMELYQDHPHYHLYYDRPQQIAVQPPSPSPPSPSPPTILSSGHAGTVLQHSHSAYKLPRFGDQFSVTSNNTPGLLTSAGSDDESYDHRLRAKRAEEIRGKNLLSRSNSASYHSSSGTGSHKKRLLRNGMIRINSSGLPKPDYNSMVIDNNWSPNPLVSPYANESSGGFPFHQPSKQPQPEVSTSKTRLRLPSRQRRISGPPQTVELSLSARSHARNILQQLMQDISVGDQKKREWGEVIMNILLKVANNVQPDIRAGDDMDVRHYVKIKKIPGGLPSDSFFVKGVVCTKNVAHKRMMKNITQPRILILMFSLDYSRVEMENQLLSIAPVISQERDHIRKLVGRIVALKPTLLLVKSTVSRLALEFLLEANIPVIHNVKHSVLEAIARCTQASIVTSVDKLQYGLSFGRCGSFEIRTYIHEWIPNRRKTFLIFDDCAPELGGTIVLRGENVETLRIIKYLIDFMVFVVNNLKLETSLMLDSFAKSKSRSEADITQVVTPVGMVERNRSPLISVATNGINSSTPKKQNNYCGESMHSLEDSDNQTISNHYISDFLKLYQNTILSVSQCVVFPPPYLLLALKDTEDKLALINVQKRRKSISGSSFMATAIIVKEPNVMTTASTTRESIAGVPASSPTKSMFERQSIYSNTERSNGIDYHFQHQHMHDEDTVMEAEYDLIAKNHQISRAWEAYIGENPESISPFYHQNIVVLYSSVCTVTTVPCQGPEIRIFSFYRFPSDKTLGQYVMDFCNDARQPCSSFMCDHPMLQHYRSYAHGNARVNVMIEPFACPLPGMQDKLLTWSYCKECNKPTPVLPVSENTWNYSFGKFLEIFLYQKDVYCRADICPHDMARNHVRYFGYMDLTVRFQYDPIELLEVSPPPMKLFILSQVQMDIKDAELKLLRSKINKFYQSIIERNKAFPFDLVDPRKLEACKAELQDMSLEAQGEKKEALQLVQNVYATSDPYDTLPINGVRRNLFQVVNHWEAVYADFVRFYLQPERELKKITAIQLRKMFPTDITDAAIFNMDNERTKRATEVTDLPLLGIGLDGEDDDALIGHILKRKSAATKNNDEISAKGISSMILPTLSVSRSVDVDDQELSNAAVDSSNTATETDVQFVDPVHKNSFLPPEVRRRLSLDLMHELNEKFKVDDGAITIGIEALNRATSKNFLRVKSPGTLSTTFTPSRIPIPRSGRNSMSSTPPIYEPFNRLQRNKMSSFIGSAVNSTHLNSDYISHRYENRKTKALKSSESRDSVTSIGSPSTPKQHGEVIKPHKSSASIHNKTRRHRHHSTGHSQYISQRSFFDHLKMQFEEEEDGEDQSSSYLKRSVSKRDRKFRSRLPRKKTYIQVYTRANDLVLEDMDDEFGGVQQDDALSVTSTNKNYQHHHHHRGGGKRRAHNHEDYFYSKRRDPFSSSTTAHLTSRPLDDNGDEADNDDNDISGDSDNNKSSEEKENIDYFSSLAPYTHKVIEGAAAVLEAEQHMEVTVEKKLPTSPAGLKPQQQRRYSFANPYFPFSDNQLDLSSGMSGGEDENGRDLPSANELLKAHQSKDDGVALADLRNIHPDAIVINTPSIDINRTATPAAALDIDRHSPEKNSFMKTLTNFLTDSGISNLLPLESPLQPTEYLFPDSDVVVREDEPSTIIAYTLSSEDYIDKMHDIQDCSSDNQSHDGTIRPGDASVLDSKALTEVITSGTLGALNAPTQTADDIQETLLRESGTHMRYNFSTGSAKFFCKIFFSEQFDALRRNCGCDESYIMSLASCIKWDSSGGKSGSAFLKTKDDRLLMKQMSKYELDAFLGFAPAYFQYMSEAFFSELPTVLAKIFGFYSIGYKNSATGKSMRMDVLVMENLFYQRNVKKIFDLKGSMRNRHVQSTGKQDEVLLDENLVELIYQSPLFIRTHSKEILRSSLHNDTLFLSNRNVMDYSLLVGIDEERQELIVGIVDFIRTFTWDKKLESWVKESGILGGGGKGPTIVSPRQYRIRFREAMERYFLMVPDYWSLTRQSQSSYMALHVHNVECSDRE